MKKIKNVVGKRTLDIPETHILIKIDFKNLLSTFVAR